MPQKPISIEQASPDNRIHINLFGNLSVIWGGVDTASFAYDKVRALLGYLAATPGIRHRRDKVADLLWPLADGEAARNNLRRALFELRQSFKPMGHVPIFADRNSLAFEPSPHVSVDLADLLLASSRPAGTPDSIREISRCVAHYRGPLLDGLQISDSLEFDYWLQSQRQAAHQRVLGMLDTLIGWHLDLGQKDLAIRYARRRVELAPWIEANYCELMRLLAGSGNIGQALQVFKDCREYLRRELGLDPEPDTLDLVRQLRQDAAVPYEGPEKPAMQRSPLTAIACRIAAPESLPFEECFSTLLEAGATCAEIVRLRNGSLSALHAGLLLGFFGYPIPRERTSREAIDAALDIRKALECMPGFTVRLAIHSGWSLCDERCLFPDASGELIDRLLRMLDQARPGAIEVSTPVFEMGKHHFALEICGDERYRVVGRSGPGDRLADQGETTPLVGRRGEVRSLLRHWQDASRGLAIVHVSGEPGIGKSRLLKAFAHQVQSTGGMVKVLRCQPDEQHTPYFPLAEAMQRHFGDQPNLAADVRLGHIRRQLDSQSIYQAKHLPIIARLLGLPSAMDAIGDSSRAKQASETALCELLEHLASRGPLLVILEDLHWADTHTLDLLRVLIGWRTRSRMHRLLLVTSSRHDEQIAEYVPAIRLSPLSEEETKELARAVGGGQLAKEQLAQVVRRTDGVPLYIEQIVRCLREGNSRDPIPDTLRDLLAARIAAQGEHRKLAQSAAVIGREFDAELLSALWGGTAESLQSGLTALCANGLVDQSESGLAFRHALIRDAAYLSLPLEERRSIHLRLARVLRLHFAEWVRRRPELLARHLHEAHDSDAAAAWLAAGRHAAGISMQLQAIHYFESGLKALAFLADPVARNDMEFRLQVGYGNALIALKGYGNQESKAVFARALAMIDDLSVEDDTFQVLWGLWLGGRSVDSSAPPLSFAHRLAHAARNSNDSGVHLQVNYAYGNNYFWLGRYAEARRHLEAAIQLAQTADSAELIARYGENSGIPAMAFLSWIDWLEGRPIVARQRIEEAVAAARKIGHAHTLAFALTFSAVLFRHLRLPAQTMEVGRELAPLAETNGLGLWQAVAALVLGWAAAAQGDDSGLASIRFAVAGAEQAMSSVLSTFLSFLVDAELRLGRLDAALEAAERSIATAETVQDVYLMPELLRLKGEILLARDPAFLAEARRLFNEGLAMADQQGAKILALRLACNLAGIAEPGEGHRLLAARYAECREGRDLPDLLDARLLLERLSGQLVAAEEEEGKG